MEESKPRNKRRTKLAIERDIMKAVKELVDEVGFSNVTLGAVIAKAQIEPPVFYKRYKDLDELFDKFVWNYDFWFIELASAPNIADWHVFYTGILKELISSFSENKTMQRMLLWELEADNPTTVRMAMMRDIYTESLMQKCDKYFLEHGIEEIRAATALLISGIYYLVLHRERSTFCGIRFDSKPGIEKLQGGLEFITKAIFSQINPQPEVLAIAQRMKGQGLDDDLIAKCTLLDHQTISELRPQGASFDF